MTDTDQEMCADLQVLVVEPQVQVGVWQYYAVGDEQVAVNVAAGAMQVLVDTQQVLAVDLQVRVEIQYVVRVSLVGSVLQVLAWDQNIQVGNQVPDDSSD